MNKREFLKKMERYLVDLNDVEREKFINYYAEIIDDYLENGFSEFDAIKKIGNPKEISAKLLEETGIGHIDSKTSLKDRWLLIVTFPIWGTLYLTWCTILICVPISLLAIEVGLVIVGIVSVFGSPLVIKNYNMPVGIVQLGIGIICAGLAIVLFLLLSWSYRKARIWLIGTTNRLKRFL